MPSPKSLVTKHEFSTIFIAVLNGPIGPIGPIGPTVPSPGRWVTLARYLYQIIKAKIRASDPRDKTVHIKCAVSQVSRHLTRILNYLHSSTQRSKHSKRSKPGTQGHTSATSLREQNSKLRVSDPRYGAANTDVSSRQPSQGWRVWRAPRSPYQELTRLVCSAS